MPSSSLSGSFRGPLEVLEGPLRRDNPAMGRNKGSWPGAWLRREQLGVSAVTIAEYAPALAHATAITAGEGWGELGR